MIINTVATCTLTGVEHRVDAVDADGTIWYTVLTGRLRGRTAWATPTEWEAFH